jgi:hypothetical protein
MTHIVKKTLEKLSSFNETSKLYIYSKIKDESFSNVFFTI